MVVQDTKISENEKQKLVKYIRTYYKMKKFVFLLITITKTYFYSKN